MFLKKNKLKALMKAAYKTTGLVVGHSNDGIKEGHYIAGNSWVAWFAISTMPKTIKAAVIELCGEFPDEGQFRATKEGNQYEIPDTDCNIPMAFAECRTEFNITGFLRECNSCTLRVLQPKGCNAISCIDNRYIEMIDGTEIDYDDGESGVIGPVSQVTSPNRIYWGNDRSYFMACVTKTNQDSPDGQSEQKMWDLLSNYRLN